MMITRMMQRPPEVFPVTQDTRPRPDGIKADAWVVRYVYAFYEDGALMSASELTQYLPNEEEARYMALSVMETETKECRPS